MREGDTEILAKLEQIRSGVAGGSGGITAVVQDPAPKLGGTLDFNGKGAIYTSKFRIKTDGTFQLYNPDSAKYHTLSLSGNNGSVTIIISAGEA